MQHVENILLGRSETNEGTLDGRMLRAEIRIFYAVPAHALEEDEIEMNSEELLSKTRLFHNKNYNRASHTELRGFQTLAVQYLKL